MVLAKALLSRAWSGGSMVEGVRNMTLSPNVKQELPDDPNDLQAFIKDAGAQCKNA